MKRPPGFLFPSTLFLATACVGCGDPDSSPSHTPDDSQLSSSPDACAAGYATEVISVAYGSGAGFGQGSMPEIVLGPPHGAGTSRGSLHVVSLGIGGEIVLGFPDGLADGPGADLIVFENAFWASEQATEPFAEPGEVAVSEDLSLWHTFPCQPQAYPYTGCAGWQPVLATGEADAALDAATAGGDAFDLADLGVVQARYVRIRDVGGRASSAGTSGFDLDAVAVLHPACP